MKATLDFNFLNVDVGMDIKFSFKRGRKGKKIGDPTLCFPDEPNEIDYAISLYVTKTKHGASATKYFTLDDDLSERIFDFIEDKVLEVIDIDEKNKIDADLIERKIREGIVK